MAYFDQAQFAVRMEWGMAGVTALPRADAIVIVDVLSFSTCVDVAVGRGVTVLPYRHRDEGAAAYAAERGAVVARQRGIAGSGGLSLSPASLIGAAAWLRLVLPSPNGSAIAFAARESAAVVVAGCLRNASAVARWVADRGRSVNIVAAGERWADGSLRVSVEDLLGAGAVVRALPGEWRRSPEAVVAAASFDAVRGRLEEVMLGSASGRELVERGFAEDVRMAAALDVSEVVPVLRGDGFEQG